MKFINLIYPNVCGMCEEISKGQICNKCKLKIKKLIKPNIIEYKDKYFNNHIYLFKYEGEIREKILKYKFDEKTYLINFFQKLC